MLAENSLSPIVGLLLAGGAAHRFGRQKLLEPFGSDVCVAGLACRKLVHATDRVIAIVRPGALDLANHLVREGAQVVTCAEAYLGMGVTLAHGVAASKEAAAWLIALADMPAISTSTLQSLSETLRLGHSLVIPSYEGRRGHPVGFASRHYESLLQLDGDLGARSIVNRHLSEATIIPVDDPGILLDIDVENDLRSGIQFINTRTLNES